MAEQKDTPSPSPTGHLTLYILAAIVLAVIVAVGFPHFAIKLSVGGEIFLRLLMMMVVPLVMASVMSGIIGLGDVRKLGKPGVAAVTYYAVTTVLAVLVGLVVVNLIEPGVGTVDREYLDTFTGEEIVHLTSEPSSIGDIFENLLLMLFTRNLILSAAEMSLLPLIFFSIVFAAMLTTMGDRVKAITQMIVQVNDALLNFILLLMKLAPIGIFCLVTARFGEARAEGRFLEVLGQTRRLFRDRPPGSRLSRFGNPAIDSLGVHQAQPLSLHGSDVSSPPDCLFDGELLGNASHHDEVRRPQRGRFQAIGRVRSAGGCDDQHGRDRALRGGGGDLHRAGRRVRAQPRPTDRRRRDGDFGRHRRRRDSRSGLGHHGHRIERSRPAHGIHRPHPRGRLASRPVSHGGEHFRRLRRRRSRGGCVRAKGDTVDRASRCGADGSDVLIVTRTRDSPLHADGRGFPLLAEVLPHPLQSGRL